MLENYIAEIKSSSNPSKQEAEKIFLCHQSWVFVENQSEKYNILKEIADYFKVSVSDVRISGSSQLGYSPIKQQGFKPGVSDLDVAIISSVLFSEYIQIAKSNSSDFNDRSAFPVNKKNQHSFQYEFCKYAASGFF